MTGPTREQFNAAVSAAIAGVEHLYGEVDLLLTRLREKLAEEPEPLIVKGILGKASRAESSRRIVVRYELGALFEAASDDDAAADDEEEEEDDEDPDAPVPAGRATRHRRGHEISASQPLLAVRVGMYHPRRREAFEPQLQFAVMNDWSLGSAASAADDSFTLHAYMLKRLVRELADRVEVPAGTRIHTRVTARRERRQPGDDRRLSCSLPAGVQAVPLYSLNNAEAVEDVADRMKAMWVSVVGS